MFEDEKNKGKKIRKKKPEQIRVKFLNLIFKIHNPLNSIL